MAKVEVIEGFVYVPPEEVDCDYCIGHSPNVIRVAKIFLAAKTAEEKLRAERIYSEVVNREVALVVEDVLRKLGRV